MKNNNNQARFQFLFIVIFFLSFAASANAALYSRLNGQAVYDSDLNITWLADANLAATNTFGVAGIGTYSPGGMNWITAQTWIGAMNSANYLGFNDWRMPTTMIPDPSCDLSNSYSYNCTGSEMGHLFYIELGGTAGNSVLTSGDPDLALFSNIQVADLPYISGTIVEPTPSTGVWAFHFGNGDQFIDLNSSPDYVWVVRTGDVAAVPVPAALWLFGSGLIGILGFMRRGQRK